MKQEIEEAEYYEMGFGKFYEEYLKYNKKNETQKTYVVTAECYLHSNSDLHSVVINAYSEAEAILKIFKYLYIFNDRVLIIDEFYYNKDEYEEEEWNQQIRDVVTEMDLISTIIVYL